MKYRIKKIITKNYKTWYIPQYKKKFLFLNRWVDIDDGVVFGEFGYETKEEAMRRLKVRVLYDEYDDFNKKSLKKLSSEVLNIDEKALIESMREDFTFLKKKYKKNEPQSI